MHGRGGMCGRGVHGMGVCVMGACNAGGMGGHPPVDRRNDTPVKILPSPNFVCGW